MKKRFYIFTIWTMIFVSCTTGKTHFRSEKEFQVYLNDPDNGFIEGKETKELLIEAKLVPPLKGDTTVQVTIQIRINRKDGRAVLETGNVSQQEILDREAYLSFGIEGDVHLIAGDSLLPVVFHHYERNYGLKPSIDMYFIFSGIPQTEDLTLTYDDHLFGQGSVEMKFDKHLLKSCYVEN